MHRVLQWDLRHAGLARDYAALLPDIAGASAWRRRSRGGRRSTGRACVTASFTGMPTTITCSRQRDRMTGLLDFGDMVHTAVVCELAVALAYAMLERAPIRSTAAAAVIRGYHRPYPLNGSGAASRSLRWCGSGWPRALPRRVQPDAGPPRCVSGGERGGSASAHRAARRASARSRAGDGSRGLRTRPATSPRIGCPSSSPVALCT